MSRRLFCNRSFHYDYTTGAMIQDVWRLFCPSRMLGWLGIVFQAWNFFREGREKTFSDSEGYVECKNFGCSAGMCTWVQMLSLKDWGVRREFSGNQSRENAQLVLTDTAEQIGPTIQKCLKLINENWVKAVLPHVDLRLVSKRRPQGQKI